MQRVITRTCMISMVTSGILYVKITKGSDMDLGDAIDNFVVIKNMSAHQPVLTLLDVREKRNLSKEAGEFIKKTNTAGHLIATALLVNSFFEKYLGKYSQTHSKACFPVKLFISEEAAVKWLLSFKKNNCTSLLKGQAPP